jgi:hypothetical protein
MDFKNVLQTMPQVFTSNTFTNKCRTLGVPEILLSSNTTHRAKFLLKNCRRLGSSNSKTWQRKKYIKPNITHIERKIDLNEEKCIEFLKNKGYKIYKTIEI